MAKFNFSNFKESLNGLTKRAKNIKGPNVQILLAIAKENAQLLQTKVWAGVLQNTDLLDYLLSL